MNIHGMELRELCAMYIHKMAHVTNRHSDQCLLVTKKTQKIILTSNADKPH